MASRISALRRLFQTDTLAYVGISVAIIGLVAAFASIIQIIKFPAVDLDPTVIQARQMKELQSQVADLRQQQQKLATTIEDLSKVSVQPQGGLPIKQMQDSLAAMNARQEKLDQIILDSPAKALELPLIRRDLDNVRDKNQADLLAIRQDVDRVYDQNKWFLGLIGTMVLGTLTLAISNFFKKEKNL